jgi:hypothetical protein
MRMLIYKSQDLKERDLLRDLCGRIILKLSLEPWDRIQLS